MIESVYWYSYKVTFFSCFILMKLEISGQIFEEYSNIKFHEIHPVGAELFHAESRVEGRTDMTKLIVASRSFANALKITEDARTSEISATSLPFWHVPRSKVKGIVKGKANPCTSPDRP